MNGLTYLWGKIVSYFNSILGTEDMGTTAKTITGAIAEHEQDISDLKDKTNTSTATCAQIASGTVGNNVVIKVGNIVFVHYVVTGISISGNGGTVCRLPEGFIPSGTRVISANVTYGGNGIVNFFQIDTSGNIKTAIGSSTVTAVHIRFVAFPL